MLLISSKAQPHKGRSEVHTVKEKPGHTCHSQLSLSEARPASYRADDATSLDTRPLLGPRHHPPATHLFGSCWSCLLAHPVPSLGTITMLGSFPLFSDFRLGRFAGGGIRRAVATFPRLCKPCLGITAGKVHGTEHTPHRRKEASSHHC